MSTSPGLPDLQPMREHFQSGVTLPFAFRKQQLESFKKAIIKNESAIYKALYDDLKKSPEEAYVSENGLVLSEISTMLKNLQSWMKPEKVRTNLVNLPSSSYIHRDPLGVVLIIAPWNYPLQLCLLPLAGAIAGGNGVVIKPSEMTPATSALIEKIITETFDPRLVKVVQGDGAEVVPGMIKTFRFDHIFYTGSIPVGKRVYQMAAEQLIPVTLELGGKSPAIVEKDANLMAAARRIALGKFTNTGQTCIAPDYVLVQNEVKEKFLADLKYSITRFYTENASDSYDYGKIINEKRFDKLAGYLGQGKISYGGIHDRSRLYISPTILEDVPESAPLMQEEIFGPLLPVQGFNTTEEAMAIVQKNPNPLAFYLFTENRATEKEWITKVPFGGGCINNADWHFTNHHLPFGGVGSSGLGSYHGRSSFETFTRPKSIMKTPAWFDPDIKYPPLKGKLKLFRRVIG
jgi:aldehyde dehydrogenase (NAD+)